MMGFDGWPLKDFLGLLLPSIVALIGDQPSSSLLQKACASQEQKHLIS
jgi:hypothetical protein